MECRLLAMTNVKVTGRKDDYGPLAEHLLPLSAVASNAYMRDRSLTLFLIRLPRSDVYLWDCWRVGTRRPDGYATFGTRDQGIVPGEHYAHRIVATLVWGQIPQGHEVDHRCFVRDCVNPLHLWVCPRHKNRVKAKRPRRRRTFCPRGHRYTKVGTTNQGRCRECQRQDMAAYHAKHRDEQNAKRAARRAVGR
jgi:hypothetical protein